MGPLSALVWFYATVYRMCLEDSLPRSGPECSQYCVILAVVPVCVRYSNIACTGFWHAQWEHVRSCKINRDESFAFFVPHCLLTHTPWASPKREFNCVLKASSSRYMCSFGLWWPYVIQATLLLPPFYCMPTCFMILTSYCGGAGLQQQHTSGPQRVCGILQSWQCPGSL